MAYNEFSLDEVEARFGLRTDMKSDYFAPVAPVPISEWLRQHLDKRAPLAMAIGTEKANSELLIMPVLLEAHDQFGGECSLFSGVDFSPDPDRGLRGVCDFLLSLSPEQLTIKSPVVAIVEAKNDNIKTGWGQCVAEMVAAQIFNHRHQNEIETIYGVVTTGSVWRFLRLCGTTVYVDRTEYYLKEVDKVVGVLLTMLRDAAAEREAGHERKD
ncbi:MAG TPA: hypothetical protein VKU00_16090 [Chthonomonadaceae bacterium]|nr:hypothetical protein [Chthonomonadaceae bacterium]